ncbi:hypothetical protein [Shewanella nanhaiensis]|uniref:Uncharacterized protein n=1 Tax=Shewanella nanhaiensis TaxID=2864872 RepID=A0ABS7E331_9GAMM|nr:hypothetical protein [Shewanella nanhaiensis]MBW8184079.1 hypothetical protein [Shewanella nanhaiensis]
MITYFKLCVSLLILLIFFPIFSALNEQRFLVFEDGSTHVEVNQKFATFTAVSNGPNEYRFVNHGFYIKLPGRVYVYFPTLRSSLDERLKLKQDFNLNPYSPVSSINSILIFKHDDDFIRFVDNSGGHTYKIITLKTDSD